MPAKKPQSKPKSRAIKKTKKVISNYYTRNKVDDLDENGKPNTVTTIIKGEHESFNEIYKHFYTYSELDGKRLLIRRDKPTVVIDKSALFMAELMNLDYDVDFVPKSGVTKDELRYLAIVNSERKTRFSGIPEMVEDDDTIYRTFPYAAKATGAFRKLLDIVTVQDEKSRYRLAAGILSGFFPVDFDGDKPIVGVHADSTSSGKTAAVRQLIKICSNDFPVELDGQDKHDDSANGGVPNMSRKYALYDNLQYMSKATMKEITVNITNTSIRGWIFGASHARIPNNKSYFATFNNTESLNDDILSRMISVKMRDGRDIPTEEKGAIMARIDEFKKNKGAVISDILAIVAEGKHYLDDPMAVLEQRGLSVKRHPKFTRWSPVMALLLSHVFPEISEFNFEIEESEFSLDNTTNELDIFLTDVLELHRPFAEHVLISNQEIYEIMRQDEHFGDRSRIGSNPTSAKNFIRRHGGSLRVMRIETYGEKHGPDSGVYKAKKDKKSKRGLLIYKAGFDIDSVIEYEQFKIDTGVTVNNDPIIGNIALTQNVFDGIIVED